MIRKLKDFSFENKRVLVRAGFDFPLDDDGNITDNSRAIAVLPTIRYLLKNNAKIILMGHNGRPKGEYVKKLSMDKPAKLLQSLLKHKVRKIDNCIGKRVENEIANMKPRDIILLENLRFNRSEKSKNKKTAEQFAKSLAKLADIFIQDAYTNSHHKDVSMVLLPKLLPSAMGLQVESEMNKIKSIISKPKKPYIAIIGGAKTEKINTVETLIPKTSKIIITGVLANTFLRAREINIGDSRYDKETLNQAKNIYNKYKDKIILPIDSVVAEKFTKNSKAKTIDINNITKGHIMDIGPKTIDLFKQILKPAKTIVWGGSIGVQEWQKFRKGTIAIAKYIAKLKSLKLVCGGDSGEAVNSLRLAKKMTHVSIGGGATLKLVEGKKLAAVEALDKQ